MPTIWSGWQRCLSTATRMSPRQLDISGPMSPVVVVGTRGGDHYAIESPRRSRAGRTSSPCSLLSTAPRLLTYDSLSLPVMSRRLIFPLSSLELRDDVNPLSGISGFGACNPPFCLAVAPDIATTPTSVIPTVAAYRELHSLLECLHLGGVSLWGSRGCDGAV
jgi:hypothetical protein